LPETSGFPTAFIHYSLCGRPGGTTKKSFFCENYYTRTGTKCKVEIGSRPGIPKSQFEARFFVIDSGFALAYNLYQYIVQ